MSTLRQNLAFLMSKHQLTANTLAKETGVPQPTISRILSGESSDPRDVTIGPIAERFGMSVHDFRTVTVEGADTIQLAPPPATEIARESRFKYAIHNLNADKNEETDTRTRQRRQLSLTYFTDRAYDYVRRLLMEQLPPEIYRNFHPKNRRQNGYDFQSNNLVLAIRVLPVFSDPAMVRSFGRFTYEKSILWDMSVDRSRPSLHTGTVYMMAVVYTDIDEQKYSQAPTFPSWVPPVRVLQELAADAALMGISLVTVTPDQLPSIILQIEKS